MFCKNCGARYQQNTNFCGTCGGKVGQAAQDTQDAPDTQDSAGSVASTGGATSGSDSFRPVPARPPQTESLAIVSLIMSILGVVFILPLIGSILGIVFGIMSKRKIEESGGALTGAGIAQGGIITGIVGLVLIAMTIILVIFVFLALGASMFSGMSSPMSV